MIWNEIYRYFVIFLKCVLKNYVFSFNFLLENKEFGEVSRFFGNSKLVPPHNQSKGKIVAYLVKIVGGSKNCSESPKMLQSNSIKSGQRKGILVQIFGMSANFLISVVKIMFTIYSNFLLFFGISYLCCVAPAYKKCE